MINIKKVIIHLYLNNNIFKKHLQSKNIGIKNLQSYLEQKGGSIEQIKVNYNGEEFIFENTYDLMYILYSKDEKEDSCVSITIDKDNNVANINNINADTLKCGFTIMDNQGSHLLKASVKFLIENKKIFNINKIQLTDNSYINCYSKKLKNPVQLKLSELLLLTKGYTFYGKYGFEPLDEEYKKREQKIIKKLKKLKIKDLKFDKIIKSIYNNNKKYNYIKNVYIDNLNDYYEKYKDKSYYYFMSNYFHKNNSYSCIIFKLMKDELIKQLIKITLYYYENSVIRILNI
jgi:hypothetical protein